MPRNPNRYRGRGGPGFGSSAAAMGSAAWDRTKAGAKAGYGSFAASTPGALTTGGIAAGFNKLASRTGGAWGAGMAIAAGGAALAGSSNLAPDATSAALMGAGGYAGYAATRGYARGVRGAATKAGMANWKKGKMGGINPRTSGAIVGNIASTSNFKYGLSSNKGVNAAPRAVMGKRIGAGVAGAAAGMVLGAASKALFGPTKKSNYGYR